MVKKICDLFLVLAFTSAVSADIEVYNATFDVNSVNVQRALNLLDRSLGIVFYSLASVAGQPIVNSAAYSTTIGNQRQGASIPNFQLESAAAWIQPGKIGGGERLNSSILYAANLVAGFKLSDNLGMQVRAVYVPELSFGQSADTYSLQPFSLGVSLNRLVKRNGEAWYSPTIITPLDVSYMHGRFAASFRDIIRDIEFDPDGDSSSSTTARADFRFHDQFKLDWDVVSFTTGLIVSKPFLWIFTGRAGLLTSLHTGSATVANTVTGDFIVTSSTSAGSDTIRTNDTATIVSRQSATFRPLLVSNQITAGLGISLGPVSINADVSRNLQINATAFMLQAGCWF